MPKKGSKLRTPRKAPEKLSRQRRWQIRKKLEGMCILCGKPRIHYAQHCDGCWRKIAGGKPWREGAKGRPPNSTSPGSLLVIV